MGLPIRKILSATNRNRAYYDFFKKGIIDRNRMFRHTMSPSMDVSLPTNLERFLFEATDRNFQKTKEKMLAIYKEEGELLAEEERRRLAQDIFPGFSAEDETVDSIYEVFEEYGYPMDTHTGVAMAVCDKVMEKRDEKDNTKIVVLSVANFYKFPQESLYALAAGDVKDSFKGIKRLNLLTAAKPPKFLVDFRYKAPRFKQVLPAEEKKIVAEIKAFVDGKIIPNAPAPKR
jgi:threonine synthase